MRFPNRRRKLANLGKHHSSHGVQRQRAQENYHCPHPRCYFSRAAYLVKAMLQKGRYPSGEYIGHTAQKTPEHPQGPEAFLFIDEHILCRRIPDFGKECVDCIVKGMEDHAKDMVFIGGLYREMECLTTNLTAFIPYAFKFPDYAVTGLVKSLC